MRALSLQKQNYTVKNNNSFCPLLHLVTLIATHSTKKIPSLQDKIDQYLNHLMNESIDKIDDSSYLALLETYYSHLEKDQNLKKLVQILCSKLNKNTQTQILIDLLEILAKQYHFRGQKDQQIKVLCQIFQLGIGLKKRKFKTFNSGVQACELMSQKDFQKSVNNVVVSLRNQIQSNSHTLTKNISIASQIYGSKQLKKQLKQDHFKQNKNQFMKKLIQKSQSYHKKFSEYRPSSPNTKIINKNQLKNTDFSKTSTIQNSSFQNFLQKDAIIGVKDNQNVLKKIPSKSSSKKKEKDLVIKIRKNLKSKAEMLQFNVLLYELYTICLLRLNSELKKKYYHEARNQLKDKLVREYPGRNIEQVLFEIELDKLKAFQTKKENKQTIKMFSPSSNSLRKKKISSSSSAGKLGFNNVDSPAKSLIMANKSTSQQEMKNFEEQRGQKKQVNDNLQMMGIKVKHRLSNFNTSRKDQQNERVKTTKDGNILKQKLSSRKNIIKDQEQQIYTPQNQSIVERKSTLKFRSRALSSSKSQRSLPSKKLIEHQRSVQKSTQTPKKKASILNINKLTNDENNKKNIFQRLKMNKNNRQKINLKKKAKQLIKDKNIFKLKDFTKSAQNSQINNLSVNGEIQIEQMKEIINIDDFVSQENNETKEALGHSSKLNIRQEELKCQIGEQINQDAQQTDDYVQQNNLSQKMIDKEQQIVENYHQEKIEIFASQQPTEQNLQNKKVDQQENQYHLLDDIEITSIVSNYLKNELQQRLITDILKQLQREIIKQPNHHYVSTKKINNQKQPNERFQHHFYTKQKCQQTHFKEQKNKPIISDRRIPLCDLSYEKQESIREDQTVYEIMIKDTPLYGRDLYESTSGLDQMLPLQQQNNDQIDTDTIQNLLNVPILNQSQEDFIQQRKINDSSYMQNQIQTMHGFGQIKQMEISILSCDEDQDVVGQNFELKQILAYLSLMYVRIIDAFEIDKTNQKQSSKLQEEKDPLRYLDNSSESQISVQKQQQGQYNFKGNQLDDIGNIEGKVNNDNCQQIKNKKIISEEILNIQNGVYSLLNASNIQYSETSKLNITEFSPIIQSNKFPPQQDQKSLQEEISILGNNEAEMILFPNASEQRNSKQQDLADMANLIKNHLISSTQVISSKISIDTKQDALKSDHKINRPSIVSEINDITDKLRQKCPNFNGLANNTNMNLLPRQETIESTVSSHQESHSIIIANHLLKPQIYVSDTLVRLTVFHPEEKKTCQVQKLFTDSINVKDYMKGLQARVTKYLDILISKAKKDDEQKSSMLQSKSMMQSKSMLQSGRFVSDSLKRSKNQYELERSRVDDLINHGHHPLNWQYIVDNINQINLDQQLLNLKSLKILYKKGQYLTLNLMHYIDYNRLIVEYKKNPLELRPVEISLDLNQSFNEITSLFEESNVKIELTEINNEIKPILQVYNLWCIVQNVAINLKNSTSRVKSLFKLNQYAFKSPQNITRYNMLIQMIHNENDKENLIISDLAIHDRNKLVTNFSVIIGYAVKIDKGKSKFIASGKQVKNFMNML